MTHLPLPLNAPTLDFTQEEVRALLEVCQPHPALGNISLACKLALAGTATLAECARLQTVIAARRAAGPVKP